MVHFFLQHYCSRDAHDTFFISNPATSVHFPEKYLEKVKKVHSTGGFGSQVLLFLLSKDLLLLFDVSGLWVRLEGGGGPKEPVEDPHNSRVSKDAVQAGAGEGVCATEVLLNRQGLQVPDPATQLTVLPVKTRNETLDATHLAEFHQIEGVIADRGLTLGDLIGVLYQFFQKLGIGKL